MDNHMKKAAGCNSAAFEAVEASVSLVMQLLHSNEINRVDLNEMLRQCESLKIAIQAKLAKHVN
jgi:hypothetical protein